MLFTNRTKPGTALIETALTGESLYTTFKWLHFMIQFSCYYRHLMFFVSFSYVLYKSFLMEKNLLTGSSFLRLYTWRPFVSCFVYNASVQTWTRLAAIWLQFTIKKGTFKYLIIQKIYDMEMNVYNLTISRFQSIIDSKIWNYIF